jgi:hypothetical protein
MRGDQSARRRINRAVEANSNGVTETERTEQKEPSQRITYRGLEALQGAGFSLHIKRAEPTNRRPSIDTLKFKIPIINLFSESRLWHAKTQRPPGKRFKGPFAFFAPLREQWSFNKIVNNADK